MSPILCNLDRENITVIASRTQVARATSRSRAMIVTQIFSQLNEVTNYNQYNVIFKLSNK